MKKIQEIRQVISNIPGAFWELPPEDAERSNDPAIKTLWDPERVNDSSLAPEMAGFSDEEESFPLGPDYSGPEEIFEYAAEIDEKELVRALGGGKGEEIKQAILASKTGGDELGWYLHFHFRNVNPGIYMPISSILYVVWNYLWHLPTDFQTKFKLAFRAIHQHELFHFAVDNMAAQWEGITSQPCLLPGKERLRDQQHNYNLLEEELANTQMLYSFRWANKPLNVKGKTEALRRLVKNSGPGYRDALKNTQIRDFDRKCEKLAVNYLRCISGYEGQHLAAVNINDLFLRFPRLDWRYCPIHILHDEKKFNLPLIYLDLPRFPRKR